MRFFGRKDPVSNDTTKPAQQQVAPGTQLRYDVGLIDHFISHHRALVDLITKIKSSVQTSRFDDTTKFVHKFKLLLNEHLLEENLRLYTYLSHCLKGDPEGSELMHEMRQEMGDIGRKVSSFIKHYSEFGVDGQNAAKFLTELDQITSVLGDRVAREERSLYTMYLPPQDIQTR